MLPLTSTQYDAERRIWSGLKHKEFYHQSLTVGEVIYDKLSRIPNKIIQIYDGNGEKMTCRELLENSAILAKYLLECGIKKGQNIGLYADYTPHTVTAVLASFLCGVPVNPVFQGFDEASLSQVFNVTQPKVIFCDIANFEIARNANEKLKLNAKLILVNGVIEGILNIKDLLIANKVNVNQKKTIRFPCLDMAADDNAVIMCSSGTTGPMKGVSVTHRKLLNEKFFLNLKDDSIVFSFALFWISGMSTLCASLINGCLRIITSKQFSAEYYLDVVQRYKITHSILGAHTLAAISMLPDKVKIQQSLASIDTLVAGGATISTHLQQQIEDILSNNTIRPGLAVAYGMTELSGILTYNGSYHTEHLVGSVGKILANKMVRIIGKDGEFLGPNESGEICITTPCTWHGYYRNAEATAKALKNNWLHSGDIGYFGSDGFLHVTGRNCDIFYSNNFHIDPQGLEEILLEVPGVQDVGIFGIPDIASSHLIACAVVRTADEWGLKLTASEIEEYVKAKRSAAYHLSGGVYFTDCIPRTPTGKIKRTTLLDILDMKTSNGNCN